VEKYLPEFTGQMMVATKEPDRLVLKHPARSIKIRDILSHTSGLPFMSRIEHKIDSWPLETAVAGYALTPLQTEPGTHYDYSNAGINTAGRIIEVVSGMPYEEFMSHRLFIPLGMRDTTFWPTHKQLRRLAKPYKPNAANNGLEETTITQLTYPLDNRRRAPSPAGGLFSTATDVSIFCRMILNGGVWGGKRYVSEAAIQQMTCAQTGELLSHNGDGYGLGWAVSGRPLSPTLAATGGSFGHGGAYATNMQVDPRRQLVTVFMVQHAGYPGPDGSKVLPTFSKAVTENVPAAP
jgi:CubicO group peptidase (beta-lactamase class C family)